jgi:hypothetical protein
MTTTDLQSADACSLIATESHAKRIELTHDGCLIAHVTARWPSVCVAVTSEFRLIICKEWRKCRP